MSDAGAGCEAAQPAGHCGAGPALAAWLPLPGTRAWFVVLLAWLAGLAGAAVWLLRVSEHGGASGSDLALRAWLLALMCFYLSLCNSFFPLPTAWIVLLAASPGFAIVPHAGLNIVVVATLATLATAMANLNEYHLLAYMLRFGLGARFERTRVGGWALRTFDRAPFLLLALIAFVPLPIDVVRWLAIVRRYPRHRFALAYIVGRGPRYVFFAWLSITYRLTPVQILLLQLAMVTAALLGRLAYRFLHGGGGRRRAATPERNRSLHEGCF